MDRHIGLVLPPTEDRKFAYEDEHVCRPKAVIMATPNGSRGVKELSAEEQAERDRYYSYEFSIEQHTGTALTLTLRKRRRDVVAQRTTGGKVVTRDCYMRGISFAELMNLLFSECEHYEDTEAYPESIHQAMRTAYNGR